MKQAVVINTDGSITIDPRADTFTLAAGLVQAKGVGWVRELIDALDAQVMMEETSDPLGEPDGPFAPLDEEDEDEDGEFDDPDYGNDEDDPDLAGV